MNRHQLNKIELILEIIFIGYDHWQFITEKNVLYKVIIWQTKISWQMNAVWNNTTSVNKKQKYSRRPTENNLC